MKKLKKFIIFAVSTMILAAMFSSCAIDRKCPAYSQAKINTSDINV